MADTSRTIATSVDEFEPSLWHFIGQLRAQFALMALVDQYYHDRGKGRNPQYPTILLTGCFGWGRRTLARAVHEAMGNLLFREPGHILGTSEDPIELFEGSSEHTTFYIPNLPKICPTVVGQLVYLIREGFCYKSAFPMPNPEKVPIGNRLIILSADQSDCISPDILRHITLRCDLTGYNNPQIKEILQQCVAGLNWSTSDSALDLITLQSGTNPAKAMKILQLCHSIARANDEDSIDLTHAKQALAVGL
jgi:Holliday junction resolvasome RuvABC ATP-dependent DNA helicase subunit